MNLVSYIKNIKKWSATSLSSLVDRLINRELLWWLLLPIFIIMVLTCKPYADASRMLVNIYDYTTWTTIFVLLATPFVRFFLLGHWFSMRQYVLGFVWLMPVQFLLVEFGDSTIEMVRADPLRGMEIVVSGFLVSWITNNARSAHSDVTMMARGRMVSGPKPTQRDDKATALHEAGHALLHAALPNLPEYFEVVIEQNNQNGSMGYVTGVMEPHLLSTRVFSEWTMLMLRAGMAAEDNLEGGMSLGGESDYQKWLCEANIYLSNGFRGPYYADPQRPEHINLNQVTLNNFQRDQDIVLAEFVSLNRDVLTDLANELIERRRMNADALTPFMERVRFPQNFPRPYEIHGKPAP